MIEQSDPLEGCSIEGYLKKHLEPIGVPYGVDYIAYPSQRLPCLHIEIAGQGYSIPNDADLLEVSKWLKSVVQQCKRPYIEATINDLYGD